MFSRVAHKGWRWGGIDKHKIGYMALPRAQSNHCDGAMGTWLGWGASRALGSRFRL